MNTKKQIRLNFPIPRTHCGIALGNGAFGALVWGTKKNILNITISRNDFWDRRFQKKLPDGISYAATVKVAEETNDALKIRESLNPRESEEKNEYASSLIPGGRVDFQLRNNIELDYAELDCGTGVLTIAIKKSSSTLRLQLSPLADILSIEDADSIIENPIIRPAWEWIEEKLKARGCAAPRILQELEYGWIQDSPVDESLCACCRRTESGFGIALSLGENSSSALAKARENLEIFSANTIDEFTTGNTRWWNHYWSTIPTVSIPNEFFSTFIDYAQYKFACATNPNAPQPCPLQGPWLEEYQMPTWGADYTVNINIEQIYYLAFYGGNLDHLIPLFDMLDSESFQSVMKNNAKALLGIDDGLLLTHSVNDKGYQCQLSFSPHSTFDHMLGAWMTQLYWLYYHHTLDRDFLANRAFPMMKGMIRTYEAMLEERDGYLSLPLSVSPEYGVSGFVGRQSGRDSSAQFAAIHMLLDMLFETCEILGETPADHWLDMKRRVPLFTLIPSTRGKERIAIWEGEDLEVCHRHHSHLAAIYPFDCVRIKNNRINVSAPPKHENRVFIGQSDEEKNAIIKNSINHWLFKGMGLWSEWCFPWAAVIQARLGLKESPFLLLETWRKLFVNEGLASVYIPRFEGITAHREEDITKPKEGLEFIQLDGTMGSATAIYEMLVHTHSGVTKIFPATPSDWSDISFENIRQPGPFSISASKQNGVVDSIQIESLGGTSMKIDVPGVTSMTLSKENTDEEFSLPGTIQMRKGEKVTLRQ